MAWNLDCCESASIACLGSFLSGKGEFIKEKMTIYLNIRNASNCYQYTFYLNLYDRFHRI